MEIDASHSSELWLNQCRNSDSICYAMVIYCPPMSSDTQNCHIIGPGAPANFNISCVNGFNGVDFNGYTEDRYGAGIGAYMHCESNLKTKCLISSDSWSCDADQSSSTICDNPPTPAPTTKAEGLASDGLSIGWILIICCFSLFIVYCVGGFVYYGQKNKEWGVRDIPNYGFWVTLPKYVWVGCQISYRFMYSKVSGDGGDGLLETDEEIQYDL